MNRKTVLGVIAALLYVGTVWAANAAVTHWMPWVINSWLIIPAGVWFAGLAFTLRDITQRTIGPVAALAAIAAGSILSYALGSKVAVAAALAFAVSEVVDMAIFTAAIRRYSFPVALVASNSVALVVDSWLFLTVAPPLFPGAHNLDFLPGQIVGKAVMTLLALLVVLAYRRRSR